jgi:hypothetical protein
MAHAISSPTPFSGTGSVSPSDLAIPLRQLAPWLVLGALFAMSVVVLISSVQGAITIPAGTAIHEWVHDGRHLLGFPCH